MNNEMNHIQIKKSNELIELTSYNLPKAASIVLLYLIAQLKDDNSKFPLFDLHYDDIRQIANLDGKKRVKSKEDVFHIMNQLNTSPIRWEDERYEHQVVWLTKLRRDKKTGRFSFYFHPDLKKYLLQLKSHFTKYSLFYTFSLSPNSIKMYELMKRYQFKGSFVITIEKLKFQLALQGRYERFQDFKRRVLTPAQEELSKFTDVKFKFKVEEKINRRIHSLKFFMSENVPKQLPSEVLELMEDAPIMTSPNEQEESEQIPSEQIETNPSNISNEHTIILNELSKWGIAENKAKQYIQQYGTIHLSSTIEYVEQKAKLGKVESKAGFLIEFLQQGWKSDILENKHQQQQIKNLVFDINLLKNEIEKVLPDLLSELEQKEYEANLPLMLQLINTHRQVADSIYQDLQTTHSIFAKYYNSLEQMLMESVSFQKIVPPILRQKFPKEFEMSTRAFEKKREKILSELTQKKNKLKSLEQELISLKKA